MSFSPKIIKLDSSEKDGNIITDLQLVIAPGVVTVFRSVVALAEVERMIRSGQIKAEVGGIFGDIWKGIKKVGKAIGIDKVVKAAKSVVNNPVINAVFPVTKGAKDALDVAEGLSTALLAKKKGHPKASKILAIAVGKAQKAGFDKGQISTVKKNADKIYQLIVRPM